jgi:hypothetical protein
MAAFAAGAMILLECMRGFLIGQRRFAALLLLSLAAGVGMVIAIPAATSAGPTAMILAYACAAGAAVAICLMLSRSLGVSPPSETQAVGRVSIFSVWCFGLGQLLGVIGLNAAGWWTASLVSRADHSMIQMGFYVAATQIRNVIAMVPGLVYQSSYALLTDEAGGGYGGAGRVLLASTLVAAVLALALTGCALAALPWALGALWGNAFRGAEPAAALAIATALVHMSTAPANSRVTILSLRRIGVINAVWAAFVIAAGPLLIPHGGAVPATAILLAAHMISAVLLMMSLRRMRALPRGMAMLSAPMLAGSALFGALGLIRWIHPEFRVAISLAILPISLILIVMTLRAGRSAGCVPPRLGWGELMRLKARFLGSQTVVTKC